MHALHLKYYGGSEQLLSNESFLMIVYFKLFYNKNLKEISCFYLLQIYCKFDRIIAYFVSLTSGSWCIQV